LIEIGHGFCVNSGTNFNSIGGDTILRIIAGTPSAQIIIGNDVGISNSAIFCFSKIEIGDGVMIGGGVKIWDSNFHLLDPIMRTSGNDTDIKTAPVKICERAFIGSGSMILKGVTIGKK
jgi:acetyltransferase-like isoleucine patch superfamily enzyme